MIPVDRVQQIVDWAITHNIIVILDFHGNNLKQQFVYTFQNEPINGVNYYTNPTSAKRVADINRFKAIWRDIANRFKDYSTSSLVFDLINEPYFSVSADEMNDLNMNLIELIRASGSNNLTRGIIINGGGASSWEVPFEISSEVLSSDNYLIATFHYYQPFNFTASSLNIKAIDSVQKNLIYFTRELSKIGHKISVFNQIDKDIIEYGVSWRNINSIKKVKYRISLKTSILFPF